MGLFVKRPDRGKVPEECAGMEVRIQSSACTGEKTIGFFDRRTGRLMYGELVLGEEDIQRFYERYGIEKTGGPK
ncbi:MAG: hypothetical protein IJ806_01965 [Ruminococcus sp.]|nr:hypothetical protein [Ruminococcus sp.]